MEKLTYLAEMNDRKCLAVPLYGTDLIDSLNLQFEIVSKPWASGQAYCLNTQYNRSTACVTDFLKCVVYNPEKRINELREIFSRFVFYVPAVHAPEPKIQIWNPSPSIYWGRQREKLEMMQYLSKPSTALHPIISAMVTQFPDPRLIQYDCGKL